MPAREGSALGAIPAEVHRTPAAFTGTRFVHEQPLAGRVGTEFDSTWIGPGKQINSVPSNQAVPESMEQNRALAEQELSFPVLAIGGERGSTPKIGNDLLPIAPNTRGLVFPCGHYIPEEEPDRLVRELQSFFKAAGR